MDVRELTNWELGRLEQLRQCPGIAAKAKELSGRHSRWEIALSLAVAARVPPCAVLAIVDHHCEEPS